MEKMIMMATVPFSIHPLVVGQPKFLSKHYDLKIVTSSGAENHKITEEEGVDVIDVDMTRKITPIKDVIALFKLIKLFLKEQPDIVYSFTPKAGLLGMMAAFLTRVPKRVHWQVGLPLMEASGGKKWLLIKLESLTYSLATKVMANSFGLRDYMNRYISKKMISVVGKGSINGVDSNYFKDNYTKEEKSSLKRSLGISEQDKVLIFTGRIVRDKGINELVEAVDELLPTFPHLKLILIGGFEENLNPIKEENMNRIKNSSAIKEVGFQKDIRPFLGIGDIFILPSYREGLPNALIEAGCFGLPLLATDINGCNEIVSSGSNGLLVKPKSVLSLKKGIETMLTDESLYQRMKLNVRSTITSRFEQSYVWNELKKELDSA